MRWYIHSSEWKSKAALSFRVAGAPVLGESAAQAPL